MSEEDKVGCETSLCIPSIDIFDFEDDKDKIDTGSGSELTVDDGQYFYTIVHTPELL